MQRQLKLENIITNDYQIINKCCIEGLKELKNNNKNIQLTITSPPYYNVKDYVNYDSYKEYLDNTPTIFFKFKK